MKITDELILRYFSNKCTEKERLFIEEWLKSNEYDSSELTDDELIKLGKSTWEAIEKSNHESFRRADRAVLKENIEQKRVWFQLLQAIPKLKGREGSKTIFPHKKLTKYAAAACVIIGVFVGGLLTGFTYAKPLVNTEPGDLLYIYSAQGVQGKLKGEQFQMRFDGKLKMYNGSLNPKIIICGDQQFVLEPRQAYYFSGSDDKIHLLDDRQILYQDADPFLPEGYVSIVRIYE